MPKKKTHGEFVEEVKRVANGDYVVLGKYVNNMTKVLIRHERCNHEWEITRANFINQNKRCPKCKTDKLSKLFSKSHIDFINEVNEVYNGEFEILGRYTGAHNKLLIRHSICNDEYDVAPTNLLSGKSCPKCSYKKIGDAKRKGLEQFKKDVYDAVGDEYIIIGNYKNNKTNTTIKHICGNVYKGTPDNFLRGNRCPKCSSSRGEKLIHEYLLKNRIEYESQYRFEDCKYKATLPFDFAIKDSKGSLKFLLEYDGVQHFQPISHFGGEAEFALTIVRDNIKNKYCKSNNIKLIRIPYWDYENIESILGKCLYD